MRFFKNAMDALRSLLTGARTQTNRVKTERQNIDKYGYPVTTYEEAVDFVAARIVERDTESPYFHHSAGMQIRNGLGMWDRDSPLHKHMVERFGLCHADDMSLLVSSAADAKLQGKHYSPDADVQMCKDHWRFRCGLDPKTMQRLDGKPE